MELRHSLAVLATQSLLTRTIRRKASPLNPIALLRAILIE